MSIHIKDVKLSSKLKKINDTMQKWEDSSCVRTSGKRRKVKGESEEWGCIVKVL
jgi:hypothetical protein